MAKKDFLIKLRLDSFMIYFRFNSSRSGSHGLPASDPDHLVTHQGVGPDTDAENIAQGDHIE